MKRCIFLFVILFFSNAYGWGVLGHKIIANLAEATLTPQAKSEMAKLLPNQKLADIATWADQVRYSTEYKYTASWHFADIPDGETYETAEHNPQGDVVQALEKQIELLKDKQTPAKERIEALKFITHFMGDIHQPLHVGRPEDRGGNMVKVVYNGKTVNLHSLWDNRFIAEQVTGLDKGIPFHPDKAIEDFSLQLLTTAHPFDPLIPGFPLTDIVNEDMAFRQDIYDYKDNVIDEEYAKKAREIVARRLYLGGERLGSVLNSALSAF